jgi:uncharacterized membrane protein YfcA
LCCCFAAGFIDAIVGGGTHSNSRRINFITNLPVSTVIGTKIPAFSGTSFAAYQYLKKVTMDWKLLLIMVLVALPSIFLGSTYLLKEVTTL